MNNKVIGLITVACDPRTMQRVAIQCRCGRRWTESIPKEVHDSQLICIFDCTQCSRVHMLRNHELRSMSKEEFNANATEQDARGFDISYDKQQYDA